jgi:prolipoprotein diacylglyceryltransferase
MHEILFLAFLAAFAGILSWWGFTRLPGERWQFMAAIPMQKRFDGVWRGVNLTWYGFFFATSTLFAVATLYVLLRAISLNAQAVGVMVAILLPVCLYASRLITVLVEGKRYGFTVGGAAFVGTLLAPWMVLGLMYAGILDSGTDPLAVMAAIAIAYAFGEGLGRLACISFGCCYGRPLTECAPWVRKLFATVHFVFTGSTKKIAYASGLDGVRVVPVQGLTVVVFSLAGLASTAMYLSGRVATAFLTALIVTQLWRAFSETLRADYRGKGKVSAYQRMALAACMYAICMGFFLRGFLGMEPPRVDVALGVVSLWNPLAIILLQALWVSIFVYAGRSTVTGSHLRFYVHEERV